MAEDGTVIQVDRGLRNMALAWECAAQAMGGPAARWSESWVSDAGSRCPFLNNATLFPVPWVQPAQPGCLWDQRVLSQPLHLFVGFVEDRPVSVSMAFVAEQVVGVYAVATLPELRGRGYGAALTWRASTVEPSLPAML